MLESCIVIPIWVRSTVFASTSVVPKLKRLQQYQCIDQMQVKRNDSALNALRSSSDSIYPIMQTGKLKKLTWE